jgi:hypothetical protein
MAGKSRQKERPEDGIRHRPCRVKAGDLKQIVGLPGDKYRVLGYNKILRNI